MKKKEIGANKRIRQEMIRGIRRGAGETTEGNCYANRSGSRTGRRIAFVMVLCLLVCSLAGCGKQKNEDWNGTVDGKADGASEEGASGGMKQEFASEDVEMGLAADESGGAMPRENFQTEEYRAVSENGFLQTSINPLSTFSADVDTASYSNVRRMLMQGISPEEIPQGAVRLEEIVNYFHYDYEKPKEGEPFGVSIDGTDCPWQPEHGLVRIGLQTESIDFSESPKSNLVFLLDVSGSMDEPNKLPLLKQAFGMLVDHLGEKDRVSIVTYAGMDQIVLDGARGNEKGEIQEALQYLEAAGSTNGSAGIETAYALAEEHFLPNGNNRVILATDGDLNIGRTSESELKTLIEKKQKSGVYLSVLGFGEGNFKDNKLETLADSGNGNYAYIDSLMEARRVLVEELGSTLYTVADDVKFQVEFNPGQISQYRLLGYENRLLSAEDFTDDTKDAGEVGAGHTVTALYEVVWAGDGEEQNPLKYQSSAPVEGDAAKEWATLKIRYKDPGASKSNELVYAFGPEIYAPSLTEANMLLESSAAEFALLLSNSEFKGNSSYGHILGLWDNQQYEGKEETEEFLELVRLAAAGDDQICGYPLAGEEGDLTFQVTEETVTADGAVFILKNATKQDLWYGEDLLLEKWEGKSFVPVKAKENTGWHEIACLLEAGTQVSLDISWEYMYGSLEPGKYRLCKDASYEDGTNVQVKAEFEVLDRELPLEEAFNPPASPEENQPSEGTKNRPPAVGLLTVDGKTVCCTYATLGSYSYKTLQPDGSAISVEACGSAPREWKEISVIELGRTDGKVELRLPSGVREYTICYWIENATCGVADPVKMEGDTILLEDETAKGTYELHVTYEEGDAYYGFKVI